MSDPETDASKPQNKRALAILNTLSHAAYMFDPDCNTGVNIGLGVYDGSGEEARQAAKADAAKGPERVALVVDQMLLEDLRPILGTVNVGERLSSSLSEMGVENTLYPAGVNMHGATIKPDERLIMFSSKSLREAMGRYVPINEIEARLNELVNYEPEEVARRDEARRHYRRATAVTGASMN